MPENAASTRKLIYVSSHSLHKLSHAMSLSHLKTQLCAHSARLAACIEVVERNALVALEDLEAAALEHEAFYEKKPSSVAATIADAVAVEVVDAATEKNALRERIQATRLQKIVWFEQALVGVDACLARLDNEGAWGDDDTQTAQALLAAPLESTLLAFRSSSLVEWPRIGWIVPPLRADDVVVRIEWPSLDLYAHVRRRAFVDESDVAHARRFLNDAASGFDVCAQIKRNYYDAYDAVRAYPSAADSAADTAANAQLAFDWFPPLNLFSDKGEGYVLYDLQVRLWGKRVEVDVSGVPPRRWLFGSGGECTGFASLDTDVIDFVACQAKVSRETSKEMLILERGNMAESILYLLRAKRS